MAIDTINGAMLDDARMLRDLFADRAALAVERRLAWALDCARLDDAMYWLGVHETIFGQPVEAGAAEAAAIVPEARRSGVPVRLRQRRARVPVQSRRGTRRRQSA